MATADMLDLVFETPHSAGEKGPCRRIPTQHDAAAAPAPAPASRRAPPRRRRLWPVVAAGRPSSSCLRPAGAGFGTTPPRSPTARCPAGSSGRPPPAGSIPAARKTSADFRSASRRIASRPAPRSTAISRRLPSTPKTSASRRRSIIRPAGRRVTGPLTVVGAGPAAELRRQLVARASRACAACRPSPKAFPSRSRSRVSIKSAPPRHDDFPGRSRRIRSRIVAGSAANNPVIETLLHIRRGDRADAASAARRAAAGRHRRRVPRLQGSRAKAVGAALPRDAGGRRQYRDQTLRLERPDAIIVGAGTLTVNADGKLDGLIRVAIAGVENIVPLLGVDRADRRAASTGSPAATDGPRRGSARSTA